MSLPLLTMSVILSLLLFINGTLARSQTSCRKACILLILGKAWKLKFIYPNRWNAVFPTTHNWGITRRFQIWRKDFKPVLYVDTHYFKAIKTIASKSEWIDLQNLESKTPLAGCSWHTHYFKLKSWSRWSPASRIDQIWKVWRAKLHMPTQICIAMFTGWKVNLGVLLQY